MTDTPQDIKDIQLKIWLSKPPMERLRQMMKDNEALFRFWKNVRQEDDQPTNGKQNISDCHQVKCYKVQHFNFAPVQFI